MAVRNSVTVQSHQAGEEITRFCVPYRYTATVNHPNINSCTLT